MDVIDFFDCAQGRNPFFKFGVFHSKHPHLLLSFPAANGAWRDPNLIGEFLSCAPSLKLLQNFADLLCIADPAWSEAVL